MGGGGRAVAARSGARERAGREQAGERSELRVSEGARYDRQNSPLRHSFAWTGERATTTPLGRGRPTPPITALRRPAQRPQLRAATPPRAGSAHPPRPARPPRRALVRAHGGHRRRRRTRGRHAPSAPARTRARGPRRRAARARQPTSQNPMGWLRRAKAAAARRARPPRRPPTHLPVARALARRSYAPHAQPRARHRRRRGVGSAGSCTHCGAPPPPTRWRRRPRTRAGARARRNPR